MIVNKRWKLKKIQSAVQCLAGVAVVLSAGSVFAAGAESQNGPNFNFGFTGGFSTMSMNNVHFGIGQLDVNLSKDLARSEGYIAPSLSMNWGGADSTTVYGGLRAVGSFTRGDGDGWGLTVGEHWQYNVASPASSTVVGKNMSNTSIDSAYLGWKSGSKISFLDKDGLDISVGPQNFQLGDGLVLADGNDEANQNKGIYWLDPRQAWNNTVVARINASPYRLELFYLKADGDGMNDSIQGANFELVNEKAGKVGLSYFEVTNSDSVQRKGMSVTSLHGRGRPVASMPTLELAGEIDFQKNTARNQEAQAWFVEASYFMPSLPWYPTIGYRFASFSGDKADTTGKNEAWDYLHNGSTPRGFGYWYQGIVVGTYETRLSNLDTHFFSLTMAPPIQGSWLKVLYYDHRFNQSSSARLVDRGAVSSNQFATEWDFVLGYSGSKKVDYMMIYGNASPGQGAREYFAGIPGQSNKNTSMLQFTALIHF
jgi:hypothetical protein